MNISSSHPLLSVIVPTYNRAQDLDRCIQSVLAQPGDFFEIVIGDDASPDHTQQVIQSYLHDARVRHYRNSSNIGMQENVLKVAKYARGDYLLILTDDDYLLPGALAKVVQATQLHPEAGYILSHLTTVDARTEKITDVHRTFKEDVLVPPDVASISRVVASAWVLSRQVLKRDVIDWETWEQFRSNIFFPIIAAGRLLLKSPGYYIADNLVMHTCFNKVYWEAFGRNELDIEFNLAADRYRCMRAILFDQEQTPRVKAAINEWESNSFKCYLYLSHLGFYDLGKSLGPREALKKLSASYEISNGLLFELCLFPLKIPFVRMWVNLKAILRKLPPPVVEALKSWRNGLTQ